MVSSNISSSCPNSSRFCLLLLLLLLLSVACVCDTYRTHTVVPAAAAAAAAGLLALRVQVISPAKGTRGFRTSRSRLGNRRGGGVTLWGGGRL